MNRYAVLLRGINLGAVNRVSMPQMREALTAAGLTGPGGGPITTYLQSGNILLESELSAEDLAWKVEGTVADAFDVVAPAVARSAEQLRAIVDGNPFPQYAEEGPKAYQVTFLSEEISAGGRQLVTAWTQLGESVAVSASGHEVYAWHPGGIHVSKLAAALTSTKLHVRVATARNWTTVLACLERLEA